MRSRDVSPLPSPSIGKFLFNRSLHKTSITLSALLPLGCTETPVEEVWLVGWLSDSLWPLSLSGLDAYMHGISRRVHLEQHGRFKSHFAFAAAQCWHDFCLSDAGFTVRVHSFKWRTKDDSKT